MLHFHQCIIREVVYEFKKPEKAKLAPLRKTSRPFSGNFIIFNSSVSLGMSALLLPPLYPQEHRSPERHRHVHQHSELNYCQFSTTLNLCEKMITFRSQKDRPKSNRRMPLLTHVPSDFRGVGLGKITQWPSKIQRDSLKCCSSFIS